MATPLAGRPEMFTGRGPRQGPADGHPNAIAGTGLGTSPALIASRGTLSRQDPSDKGANAGTPSHGSSSEKANLHDKREEHETHFVHATASGKRFEKRPKPQSGSNHASSRAGLGANSVGKAGHSALFLASSVLPAAGAIDPLASAQDRPGLFPLSQANAGSEDSPGAADWSAWGGLAPQFLVMPYFPRRPQLTVMLAIADETVQIELNKALTRAGYLVFTAETARDAMNLLKIPQTPIDAAVVDMNLPDVNGLDLYSRMRELYPRLPVMIFTDQADGAGLAQLSQRGVTHFLLKSSAMSDILAQVRALVS
jgi:CheY-like chemotaxis protein